MSSNYDGAIQDLEADATDLERQAQEIQRRLEKVRLVLAGLRELASDAPLAHVTPDSPYRAPLVLETQVETPKYQRGDVPTLVILALKTTPGMRSSALGDLLKDRITTTGRNPRKLVLNAVSYLASRHKIERDASGGWVVADDEASVLPEATARRKG